MKEHLAKTALWLVGMGLALGCVAHSVVPQEPEAYEPFTIELSASGLREDHSVLVDVENQVIQVGHRHTPDFMAPPGGKIIEIQGLPPGTYSVQTVELEYPYLPESEAWAFFPYISEKNLIVTVKEAPPTQRAYGFFHHGIKHYFVTASPSEVEIGVEVDGWELVDFGFHVWPAEGPAPNAAVPVCRFYSYEVNSHFYTADAAECEGLQEMETSWHYEGIAFQVLVPVANACPAGTDPVWRLYNNRHAEKDSNHRFVASSETYRTMIADGWIGEGVAFCSPRVSYDEEPE